MSVQIDNIKMWEYLIKQSEEYLIFRQIATWLKEALHEQGLEWNEEIRAIVSIKPEPLSPAPQRNNYDEIKQAEPKQENSPILSNSLITAKNDELTDFEKSVRDIITSELCTNFSDMSFGISISDEEARLIAKKLLQAARKQITGEIDVDAMTKEHAETTGHCEQSIYLYKCGLKDVLKKIKRDRV